MRRKETCRIAGCERDSAVSGLCKPCYNGMHYWLRNKTPGDIMKRQKQLAVLDARMEAISGNRRSRSK